MGAVGTRALGSGAIGGRPVRGGLPGDLVNQACQLRVGGNCLPEQVIHQHGIGQLEETGQGLPLLTCGAGKLAAGEAFEKDV